MSINTKLVLLLTVAVGAVMFAGSFLSLQQREAAIETATRDELRAHAVTLRIALEEDYTTGRIAEARRLADRLRENANIYAVLIFDERGEIVSISQPVADTSLQHPPELAEVLRADQSAEFVRETGGAKFASVILPLRFDAERIGAIELVKPLLLVEADKQRARWNWAGAALLLLAAISAIVYAVTRANISRPIAALLTASQALGRGDFRYRVPIPKSGDELTRLAVEFNRMAENLHEQNLNAARETENRLRLEKELRHSERLASVGRLAAGIAHELGAPLNVIDARAEQLLAKPDQPPEKVEKNLNIIRSQTARITKIVRQLLNLARPFNFRLMPVELNDLLARTLEQIEPTTANARINVDFQAAPPIRVLADQDYLTQVFVNIVQNAVQAMLAGGTLNVEIEQAADEAVIKFVDSGAGIAPENLETIFDPFYTTKDIGQGTGLGLTVSRRIVEELGGSIAAANNRGGGATLTIRLPTFRETVNSNS